MSSSDNGERPIVDVDGTLRIVDDAQWFLRVQPRSHLDPDEQERVMQRVLELIMPFLRSNLVYFDIVRYQAGMQWLVEEAIEAQSKQ